MLSSTICEKCTTHGVCGAAAAAGVGTAVLVDAISRCEWRELLLPGFAVGAAGRI
jgi:hypothetical protein